MESPLATLQNDSLDYCQFGTPEESPEPQNLTQRLYPGSFLGLEDFFKKQLDLIECQRTDRSIDCIVVASCRRLEVVARVGDDKGFH